MYWYSLSNCTSVSSSSIAPGVPLSRSLLRLSPCRRSAVLQQCNMVPTWCEDKELLCRGGFGVRGHAGPFGRAQSVLHRRLARAFLSLLVGVSSTGRLIVYINTRPAGGSGLMSSHDFFNISLFTPRLFTPSLAPSLASPSWRVSLL